MEKMTERKTWLRIGKAYADVVRNPWSEYLPRDGFERNDNFFGEAGLCDSIRRRHTSVDWQVMSERLHRFQPEDEDSSGYWWKLTQKGAEYRVMACCFLAAMAGN